MGRAPVDIDELEAGLIPQSGSGEPAMSCESSVVSKPVAVFQRLLRRAEVDRPVVLAVLALQSFVELGFHLVITQFASHEWAHLGLDRAGRIMGEPDALSRLISLGRLAFIKWYAVSSCVFVVGVIRGKWGAH